MVPPRPPEIRQLPCPPIRWGKRMVACSIYPLPCDLLGEAKESVLDTYQFNSGVG